MRRLLYILAFAAATADVNGQSAAFEEAKELKPGATYLLKNVVFGADRHIFQPESKATLDKLVAVLRSQPKLKISIEGHVCCIKDNVRDAVDIDTKEASLSVNRAKEIYRFLIANGVDSMRLNYAGFGRSKPVAADEKTEAQAALNRRVEIRVLSN